MSSRSDALVIFGATGDLAFKQIFPALLALVEHGRLDMPIVAVGRKPLADDDLHARVHKSIAATKAKPRGKSYEALIGQLRYVTVDFEDAATFARIRAAIPDATHPLHYLALPPDTFEQVGAHLAAAGLAQGARLMLEKPFGHDLASAQALSRALHAAWPEEAIFRVDHYLGKEAVENIAYFRAANPVFERALRVGEVASIQITMAEEFGIDGRAGFYDAVGAIRDVVQNHMLELLACLTMELPTTPGHAGLRAARSELLAQIAPILPSDTVRGQAAEYRDVEGVAKDSTTETFAALRVHIDSDRWRGVPIAIRVGKSLPVTVTEALVRFRVPTGAVLDETTAHAPDHLRFRIGPEFAIGIGVNVKRGGEAMAGELTEAVLAHAPDPAAAMQPYERLLGDAIDGDATLFAREDASLAGWRIVDPVLGNAVPVQTYAAATWGPPDAAKLAPPDGWHDPILKFRARGDT